MTACFLEVLYQTHASDFPKKTSILLCYYFPKSEKPTIIIPFANIEDGVKYLYYVCNLK